MTKKPPIESGYLIHQLRLIEKFLKAGYMNISVQDILSADDIDFRKLSQNAAAVIYQDLQSVLGRKLRNLIEDNHPLLRVLPMSKKFDVFLDQVQFQKEGPGIEDVYREYYQDWIKYCRGKKDPKSLDEFVQKAVRSCVAGNLTAHSIHITMNANDDPFFRAYEGRRFGTGVRHYANLVKEAEDNVRSGRFTKAEAKAALEDGNVKIFPKQINVSKIKGIKHD